MEEGEKQPKKLSRFQKISRSFSFKFPGTENPRPHVSRSGGAPAKPPRKLDQDNWVKGKQHTGTRHVRETSNIRIFNSVGDKKSMWAKKVDSHKEQQALNPFSDSFDREKLRTQLVNKDDPNYGRPTSGSLSAVRAAMGEAKMRSDICDVCHVVFHQGQQTEDGRGAIQFGPLFSIYDRINDKLVGLLIRARKRELLTFDGEMLYQRRDDEKWIELTKNINTIYAYFGRDSRVANGGEVDPEVANSQVFGCSSVESSRRPSSVQSVESLPACLGNSSQSVGSSSKGESKMSLLTVDGPKSSKSKSIRNSFRKLVKPLVKKRAGQDKVEEAEGSTQESRRDSRVSDLSLSGLTVSSSPSGPGGQQLEDQRSPESRQAKDRWRRALGVSLAIGRMVSLRRKRSELEMVEENRRDSLV